MTYLRWGVLVELGVGEKHQPIVSCRALAEKRSRQRHLVDLAEEHHGKPSLSRFPAGTGRRRKKIRVSSDIQIKIC